MDEESSGSVRDTVVDEVVVVVVELESAANVSCRPEHLV
jgi:hypothetical protein